eukprot:7382392-Prymnesium_polylepis.1
MSGTRLGEGLSNTPPTLLTRHGCANTGKQDAGVQTHCAGEAHKRPEDVEMGLSNLLGSILHGSRKTSRSSPIA